MLFELTDKVKVDRITNNESELIIIPYPMWDIPKNKIYFLVNNMRTKV